MMSAMPDKSKEVVNFAKKHYEAALVSLGILLAEVYGRQEIAMHVADSAARKAEIAVPSALVPAQVSDDLLGEHSRYLHEADTVFAAGLGAAAAGLAKETTSTGGIVGTAIAGQYAGTAVNEAIFRSGALSPAEAAQKDDGISSVFAALGTKYLMDKMLAAKTKKEKTGYSMALGGLVGALTLASYFLDRKNGLTDVGAHTGGIVAGAGASAAKLAWQKIKESKSADNTAAQTLPPAVEYGGLAGS